MSLAGRFLELGRPAGWLVALAVAGLVLAAVGPLQRAAVAHPARGVAGAAALRRLQSLPVGAQLVISATLGANGRRLPRGVRGLGTG